MITADNILSHEFIGQHTEIIQSTNPQIIGLNGTIVDETKFMFTINTSKRTRSIPKSINTWKFLINNQEKLVEGHKITKRAFDRIGVKA